MLVASVPSGTLAAVAFAGAFGGGDRWWLIGLAQEDVEGRPQRVPAGQPGCRAGATRVPRSHVKQALDIQERRLSQVRERLHG